MRLTLGFLLAIVAGRAVAADPDPAAPSIGVAMQDAAEMAETLKEEKSPLAVGFPRNGAFVGKVDRFSTYGVAGLKENDVVYSLNDLPIGNRDQFIDAAEKLKPGTIARVKLQRPIVGAKSLSWSRVNLSAKVIDLRTATIDAIDTTEDKVLGVEWSSHRDNAKDDFQNAIQFHVKTGDGRPKLYLRFRTIGGEVLYLRGVIVNVNGKKFEVLASDVLTSFGGAKSESFSVVATQSEQPMVEAMAEPGAEVVARFIGDAVNRDFEMTAEQQWRLTTLYRAFYFVGGKLP